VRSLAASTDFDDVQFLCKSVSKAGHFDRDETKRIPRADAVFIQGEAVHHRAVHQDVIHAEGVVGKRLIQIVAIEQAASGMTVSSSSARSSEHATSSVGSSFL